MPRDFANPRKGEPGSSSPAAIPVADPSVALSVMERSSWREVVAAGLYHSGALRLLAKLSTMPGLHRRPLESEAISSQAGRCRHVILCYHRVGTEGLPIYSYLPRKQFEAQIRFIRNTYRVVSLEKLCTEIRRSEEVPPSVAITFDDGYRDVYTHAFPILQAYGVPATVYATVGSINTGTVPWYDRVFFTLQVISGDHLELPFDVQHLYKLGSKPQRFRAALDIVGQLRQVSNELRKELCTFLEKQCSLPEDELAGRMLTWQQVEDMHRAGIAFGSHTMTHPVVSQLKPSELEFEMGDSRRLLEARLGCPVQDFAFPFGQPADCGNLPTTAFVERGYRSAATTTWGINCPRTDPFRLRRVQIGEECSLPMFAFKLSQLFFRSKSEPEPAGADQSLSRTSPPRGNLPASELER